MINVDQIQLLNIFRMNFQKDLDDIFRGGKGILFFFLKMSSGDTDKVFYTTVYKKLKNSKKNVKYSNFLG